MRVKSVVLSTSSIVCMIKLQTLVIWWHGSCATADIGSCVRLWHSRPNQHVLRHVVYVPFRFVTYREVKWGRCSLCTSSQHKESVSVLLWMQGAGSEVHWASKWCLLCSRSIGVDHHDDKGQGSQTNYLVLRWLVSCSIRLADLENTKIKKEMVLMLDFTHTVSLSSWCSVWMCALSRDTVAK